MSDEPQPAHGTTLSLGPAPAFASGNELRECPDLQALAGALSDLEGRANVVVNAAASDKDLAVLAQRFPQAVWWQAHGQPSADSYARHGMLRAMGHAIRSPLGVLEGALEELREGGVDDGPEWGMIERSLARLQRLAVSLSDLASVTRPHATGGEPPTSGPTVAEVARSAWQEAQRMLPLRREVELLPFDESLNAPAPGDTASLKRAMRELLINARQHGAKTVQVRGLEGGVQVIDDGPGPGQAVEVENWEAFVPARERGARSDLSVGLAIARDDAQRCGASLRLMSGEGDKGTRAILSWN